MLAGASIEVPGYSADIDNLRLWLAPERSVTTAAVTLTVDRDAPQETSNDGDKVGFARFHGVAQDTILRSSTYECLLFASGSREELLGKAMLPDGGAWPEVLQSMNVGIGTRWFNDAGWVGGVQAKAIASGPGQSWSHGFSDASLEGFLRLPDGPHTAWIASLQYDTQHVLWNHDFLPGLGYLVNPDEHLWMIIGLPWSALMYQPSEAVTISATVGTTAHVEIDVTITPEWSIGVASDWREDAFRRNGERHGELLVSRDVRFSAIASWTPAAWCECDVAGGYALGRRLSVGETDSQWRQNQISISPGPFARLIASVIF